MRTGWVRHAEHDGQRGGEVGRDGGVVRGCCRGNEGRDEDDYLLCLCDCPDPGQFKGSSSGASWGEGGTSVQVFCWWEYGRRLHVGSVVRRVVVYDSGVDNSTMGKLKRAYSRPVMRILRIVWLK